jgi:ABC-type lipoprotein release transport system permease subunit
MLSSPAGVTSVLLYGIDPARERNISMIDEAIRDGEYLQPEGERQILIGSKAAETLEAGLGDGILRCERNRRTPRRCSGYQEYRMGIREADSVAFIHIDKARQLLL